MDGSVLVKNSMFSPATERARTFRTMQNDVELQRTVLRVLLVLVRTVRTISEPFCVLAFVLIGFVELLGFWQNGSGTLFVPLLVLNALMVLPHVPERHTDTVSKKIPYFLDGKFVKYIGE